MKGYKTTIVFEYENYKSYIETPEAQFHPDKVVYVNRANTLAVIRYNEAVKLKKIYGIFDGVKETIFERKEEPEKEQESNEAPKKQTRKRGRPSAKR